MVYSIGEKVLRPIQRILWLGNKISGKTAEKEKNY